VLYKILFKYKNLYVLYPMWRYELRYWFRSVWRWNLNLNWYTMQYRRQIITMCIPAGQISVLHTKHHSQDSIPYFKIFAMQNYQGHYIVYLRTILKMKWTCLHYANI
jgi:hypothetical protein